MIDYVVGFVTIVSFWLAGSGKWYGWAMMLVNQAVWLYWTAFHLKSLPLVVVTCLITLVVVRNIVKGYHDQSQVSH